MLSKAISRIQTKVASQRNQVQLNEVEQTSVHSFTNTAQGTGHISGSYLWLDKIYQGRIYNYGRRMMFEFILPEPAEVLRRRACRPISPSSISRNTRCRTTQAPTWSCR